MQEVVIKLMNSFLRYLQDHDHDHDHDHEHAEATGAEIGLAFGLTAIAGLFTLLGAAVVFCMNKGRHALVVGVSVALSAGVMIYISFVEIFNEAVASFAGVPMESNFAVLYTTITVFGSILAAIIVDILFNLPCAKKCFKLPNDVSFQSVENQTAKSTESFVKQNEGDDSIVVASHAEVTVDESQKESVQLDKKELLISGVVAALAVILHNIPEGIITFFSTIADPSFGIIMCVAMALHNIPEGVGVAALIFHATRSKTYAILATLLAGLAEVLGALIGYGVYEAGGKNDIILAVALAFSAGIMLFVSVKKMMYLAYRVDRDDKYTSYCVFGGMAIMAASLLLLEFFSNHVHPIY